MCKENLKTLYAVYFTYLDVAYNNRDLYFVAQVAWVMKVFSIRC